VIEPLRVVDYANDRALGRGLGKQAEHGQSEPEGIGRRPGPEPERRTERILLRARDAVEPVQQGRTQLVQPREGELRLLLHARRLHDPVAARAPDQVLQQRRLADSGLAPDDQGLTDAVSHAVEKFVELPTLVAPANQHVPESI
jgi:hypothetical protein